MYRIYGLNYSYEDQLCVCVRTVWVDARDAAARGDHIALHHRQHLPRAHLVRIVCRLCIRIGRE